MRVLLDTNVLVSGLAFHGAERDLLSMIRADDHSLILNDYLITELTVIMRRKFPDKRGLAEAILGLFRIEKVDNPAPADVRDASRHIRDAKDAVILATVISCQPDLFVTGDLDFFAPEVAALAKPRRTREAVRVLRRGRSG
ncbi:MAG: putative toxin-antitoxin system toxin component, PIN family [Bacillota bacterium]|nr:putative toxin-antitoxin system toxin component, PIN family [Bacillota bacterium]